VFSSWESSPCSRRGPHRNPEWLGGTVLPGSESRAKAHKGSPGTWEVLVSPAEVGVGLPNPKLQAALSTSGSTERKQAWRQVPPSEGNEVRWDGCREVGVFRSTVEAGELASREPGGGKGRPSWRPVAGTPGGNSASHHQVNVTTTDSDPVDDELGTSLRNSNLTSRMPELGKSGSVGALGGNAQGDPANWNSRKRYYASSGG
jgi:hypothetical protein